MRWVFSLLLLAPLVAIANVENAGIVDGIWLSNPVPVENEPVRIYVAIHNTTANDLEGTVHFRIDDELLDTMRINALDGRIVESWADWVPPAGTSTITVNLRQTELESTVSGTRPVEIITPLTERVVYIDFDTDGDLQGNIEDEDDDNDGVSDKDERTAGTDPLVYDEPPEPELEPASSTSLSTTTSDNAQQTTASQTEQAGLEALIEPSITQNVLERSTNAINRGKRNLDEYRTERAAITRTQADSTNQEGGFGATVKKIIGAVYSGGLTILSWFLGYPGLVQLLFLLLVLYVLYRLARHYGRRPDY